MRNREQFQENQQDIGRRLKRAKTKQVWRVKSKVVSADEIKADEAERLAKGKAIASSSVNMVYRLTWCLCYLQDLELIKGMQTSWRNLVLK
jgi:hypothetical protein